MGTHINFIFNGQIKPEFTNLVIKYIPEEETKGIFDPSITWKAACDEFNFPFLKKLDLLEEETDTSLLDRFDCFVRKKGENHMLCDSFKLVIDCNVKNYDYTIPLFVYGVLSYIIKDFKDCRFRKCDFDAFFDERIDKIQGWYFLNPFDFRKEIEIYSLLELETRVDLFCFVDKINEK